MNKSTATTDTLPGEASAGEPRFKLTVNIPRSLYERAAGLVGHAAYTGEPAEITSLTDLVRNSLAAAVSDYEAQLHGGNAFPPPRQLRRGRRPT